MRNPTGMAAVAAGERYLAEKASSTSMLASECRRNSGEKPSSIVAFDASLWGSAPPDATDAAPLCRICY
jgi:hypothetical protein